MGAKHDKKDSGEKKPADAGGEKKSNGGSITVVLNLDLHCDGCAKKVKGSIRHFKGVETVHADIAGNKLTVTGNVDPTGIKERIEKKTKKKVEIVSPAVKKDAGGGGGGADKKEKAASAGAGGGDGEKKKAEAKAVGGDGGGKDGSRSIEVVNKLENYGQTPYTYTIPTYNQSYYNQDYGVAPFDQGYAMPYSNGPPPPPPMYFSDPRVPDAGMFSDENPNAACSIM